MNTATKTVLVIAFSLMVELLLLFEPRPRGLLLGDFLKPRKDRAWPL